ncbi:MAG: hydrogenase maturation nickel metallochaperone HypA [Bacteroidales bacterium]
MHELGIAMRIVEIAAKVARQNGLEGVDEINMEIGELSGIVPETLTFSFEVASKNTMLEHAKLGIAIIHARASCNVCGMEFTPDGFLTICPECGTFECEIIQGREIHIRSISPGKDGQATGC